VLAEIFHLHVKMAAAAHLLPAHLLLRLQASFLPNYLQITSRKLLLFHGRHSRQQQRRLPGTSSSSSGTGLVVRLSELVNSPVMAELQEMLSLGPGAEQERDLFNNWFSLQVGEVTSKWAAVGGGGGAVCSVYRGAGCARRLCACPGRVRQRTRVARYVLSAA
jgi:hypothetical protein